jgi:serine protease Do
MSLYEEDANRAMLGVTTEGDDKGAEIITVNKESGAEKAGLKKGDIITRIGSEEVEGPGDVTKAIRNHKPGDKVDITYLRDGKEQKATAELSKWKGIKMNPVRIPRVAMGQAWTPEPPRANFEQFDNLSTLYAFGRPRLGLSIQDDEDGKGAKVLEVDDDGAAAKAGLKEGDIITGIDDKEVKGTDDVTRTIRANREKYNYSFKVLRDGKTQTLEVKMPRKLKTADL